MKIQPIVKVFSILSFTLMAQTSLAFVENVSHGYVNCMACHASPSGGGLLTDYGRSLSKELMSTWGWENSEAPLFGAIKQTENFKVGGHLRALQSHFDNPQLKRGRFFLMQQNLELGYKIGKAWLIGTFGTKEGPDGTKDKGTFLSEHHYVLYELSDTSFLRVGKYKIPFGINDPVHTRSTEQGLGFGSQSETYNLEANQFSDTGELFVGASLGRIDLPREQTSEKSYYARYAHYVGEKNKVGVSYLLGESPTKRRNLLGIFGVFTPIEKLSVVSEVDFESSHLASSPTDRVDGLFMAHKGLYELFKGMKPYLVFEAQQTSLADPTSQSLKPGLGFQWIPIPHLELQAEYQRVTNSRSPGEHADVAWLITHFWF